MVKRKKIINPPTLRKTLSEAKSKIVVGNRGQHLRHAWVFKRLSLNDQLSSTDFHHNALILGSNLVSAKAIEYWAELFKLVEGRQVTEFGRQTLIELMKEDSKATFLYWHWLAFAYGCQNAVMHFTFNIFNRAQFTKKELQESCFDWCQEQGIKTSLNAVGTEVNGLLKTYAVNQAIEDQSPLSAILIDTYLREDSEVFCFTNRNILRQPKILSRVFAEYLQILKIERINLQAACYRPESPGKIYCMAPWELEKHLDINQEVYGAQGLSLEVSEQELFLVQEHSVSD